MEHGTARLEKQIEVGRDEMRRPGLVTRKVYAVVPPKTEYSLTPIGESLWEPLHNLCLWAEKNFDQVLEHRKTSEASKPAP